MKFWDREKEKERLKRYLKSEPNSILFVYGPKSSGKSTLLFQVVKELSKRKWFVQKYDMYWYDLRGIMISSYNDVVQLFFESDDKEGQKIIKEAQALFGIPNIASFSVKRTIYDEIKNKELDPFKYMEAVLRKNRKKHVIVFDELQKIKDVYMNGENQRPVVKELFNFFVRLTKVLHLSHVIVMSSDTFFIEEVYIDSTLKNTSRYYLVDYFDDDTAYNILVNKGIEERAAKEIVDKAGGVPWILEEVIESEEPLQVLEELRKESKAKILGYLDEKRIKGEDIEITFKVFEKVLENKALEAQEELLELRRLFEREILFYDPINRVVKFQTRLDELTAKELLKRV